MAAPADITLKNLNGQWIMNQDLSDDINDVLKLQGINWLTRKVLTMASVVLSINEWVDPSTGLTHFDTVNIPSSGLPSSTDRRVLNFEGVESSNPLYGKVCSRTRWASPVDLDEVDTYLAKDFEAGTLLFIHTMTDHIGQGIVTNQVYGFEQINNIRYHTRHIVVKKGEKVLRVRLVYNYLGPQPTKATTN